MRALADKKILAFGALCVVAAFAAGPGRAAPFQGGLDNPVNFEAEELSHDEAAQTVTAAGDVEFTQGGRILRAERVVYHLDTDTVKAEGNVSVLDEDGTVHFSDQVELSRDMKDGYVQTLLSMLADGSRFTATEARREGGSKLSMKNASYTPCKVCEADPKPVWQIRADKVTHDAEKKEIKYKNARLEVLGVPVLWTPVFSQADPTVKRKTGFLRPHAGWTENLGAFAQAGFYYDIAPDKDMTVFVRPTAREGVLTMGQWRQRFKNGKIQLDGSFANADRKEEDGRVDRSEWRGSLFANGLFDLDEKWRAGFNIRRASDKGYLRLYDIDSANVLENEIFAERFSGRDYSRVSAVNLQDLRLGLRPVQPEVAPLAEHHMLGAPRGLWGGRWAADLSALDLQRPGPGQDMQRGAGRLAWQRRDIHRGTGLSATYELGLRGEAYAIQANALDAGRNSGAVRGQAFGSFSLGYPLVKRLAGAQAMIEPVAAVHYATAAENDPRDIPNEDSQDVQIDPNSLFFSNRFPGIDRMEDGWRADYGVKGALHADDGRYGRAFLGQSYRFEDNAGLFPEGSGLENRSSDIVAQVGVGLGSTLSADYRIQLDRDIGAARRHEIQASGGTEAFRFDTRFIYLDAIGGTGFVVPREQWQVGGSYRVHRNWTVSSGTIVDFGDEPGVRKASAGIAYADECFSLSLQGERSLIEEASGESGTTVMLRVGFKNIGEFSSPEITVRPKDKTE